MLRNSPIVACKYTRGLHFLGKTRNRPKNSGGGASVMASRISPLARIIGAENDISHIFDNKYADTYFFVRKTTNGGGDGIMRKKRNSCEV